MTTKGLQFEEWTRLKPGDRLERFTGLAEYNSHFPKNVPLTVAKVEGTHVYFHALDPRHNCTRFDAVGQEPIPGLCGPFMGMRNFRKLAEAIPDDELKKAVDLPTSLDASDVMRFF